MCQIPVINPIRTNNSEFDDPSEPIYTDPSLFERSRFVGHLFSAKTPSSSRIEKFHEYFTELIDFRSLRSIDVQEDQDNNRRH